MEPATHGDGAVLHDAQLVVFQLADEHYGLEVADVREVIFAPEITEMPQAPAFLGGVVNLRGRVLPVVDLRKAFCLPDTGRVAPARILIAAQNDRLVGLLVDGVSQVATIARTETQATPPAAGATDDCARGVVRIADRVVLWLDLGRVLAALQRGDTPRMVWRVAIPGQEVQV